MRLVSKAETKLSAFTQAMLLIGAMLLIKWVFRGPLVFPDSFISSVIIGVIYLWLKWPETPDSNPSDVPKD